MSGSAHTAAARPNLQRRLDVFGLFALAFGSMIGVGWVTAMGSWLTQAGPIGAALAFLAGGVVMLCIGLCYAELTPMLPLAGGEVAYAYRAYGTGKAFVIGWFLAFGYISVSAFEAISVGRVLAYMLPNVDRWVLYEIGGAPVYATHLLLAIGCTAGITALNYLGVGWAARFQKWLIVAFIAITVIFIGAGLLGGSIRNIQPAVVGEGMGMMAGVAAVFVTVPFWFVGFDTIPQGAEEADASIPPKKLGVLILVSIVAATGFYAVLIVSVAMTGPWQNIAAADLATARAFSYAFGSDLLVNLVLLAALIGLLTSWNGFFLAGSRVLFSLGRGRIIPEGFGTTHPTFGTPHRAVVFAGFVTMLAPLLGRNALLAFVDVGAFCIGIAFLGVGLTTIRLRHIAPGVHRPYRIPGGLAVPMLAVAGALLILLVMVIPGSPAALTWPGEVLILSAFALLGAVFWVVGGRQRAAVTEEERAYLILEDYAPQAKSTAATAS
jgi:amino acid transporter